MGDSSMLKERLVYNTYNAAGANAPRCTHGLVSLPYNPGAYVVYMVVEHIDSRFGRDPERQWHGDAAVAYSGVDDGDGNIYKEVWPVSVGKDFYRNPSGSISSGSRGMKTNENGANSTSRCMAEFGAALQAIPADASTAEVEQALSRWLDLDAFMSHNVVAAGLNDWDGIFAWYLDGSMDGSFHNHNFYWYEETPVGGYGLDGDCKRMWVVAWDVDHSIDDFYGLAQMWGAPRWYVVPEDCSAKSSFFPENARVRSASCDSLIRHVTTALRSRYVARVEELKQTLLSKEAIEERLDAIISQIAPHMMADAASGYWPSNMLGGNGGAQSWLDAVENMKATTWRVLEQFDKDTAAITDPGRRLVPENPNVYQPYP